MQAPGLNPDSTHIGWNDHGAATYKLPERLHPTAWTGEMACEMIRNYEGINNQPLFFKSFNYFTYLFVNKCHISIIVPS